MPRGHYTYAKSVSILIDSATFSTCLKFFKENCMTFFEFFLRSMINLLYWVLTFFTLGIAAPHLIQVFAQSGASIRPFDFEGLADVRLMIGQLAAIGLAMGALTLLQPNPAPAPALAPVPGAMPGVSQLFRGEAFSAAMNFGATSCCVVIFLHNPLFLIGVVLNYFVAFRIK